MSHRGTKQQPAHQRGRCLTSPSAIVPGFLYLGDAHDAASAAALRALGIGRVVNCAGHRGRRIVTNDEGMEEQIKFSKKTITVLTKEREVA